MGRPALGLLPVGAGAAFEPGRQDEHDPGELQRAALHLTRLCEWANEQLDANIDVDRAWMRERAADRIALAPPPFHVASSAEQLRDTSNDAATLGDSES